MKWGAYDLRRGGTTLEVSTSKEKAVFLGEIFGPDLLIVVIVVAVLVFGGSAIPKLAKNLGSAKSEFEKGLKEAKTTDTTAETKAPETDK
jgi:sec-independent protein translocase protein TatA